MTVAEAKHVKELQTKVASLEQRMQDLSKQVERLEVQSAIKRGLEEIDRGEGTPARVWAKKVRAKYKLPQP